MASTNKTETLGLNQWLEDDKPNWDIDLNNDLLKIDDFAKKSEQKDYEIDQSVHVLNQEQESLTQSVDTLNQAQAGLNERLTTAETGLGTAENEIETIKNNAGALESKVTTNENNITGLRTDLTEAETQIALNTENINKLGGFKVYEGTVEFIESGNIRINGNYTNAFFNNRLRAMGLSIKLDTEGNNVALKCMKLISETIPRVQSSDNVVSLFSFSSERTVYNLLGYTDFKRVELSIPSIAINSPALITIASKQDQYISIPGVVYQVVYGQTTQISVAISNNIMSSNTDTTWGNPVGLFLAHPIDVPSPTYTPFSATVEII